MKIRLLLNYCNMKTYKNFEEDFEKAKQTWNFWKTLCL